MHCGDIRRTRIDELAVHLIGEKVKIVLLHQVAYAVHLLLGIEVARRVVRIADENGLGALVDEFFELLHLWQAEALLNGGGHSAYDCTGRNGEGHIVRVRRLRHDNLVSRIEAAHKSEQYCLGATGGDDDFIRLEFDLIALIVAYESFTQAPVALGRGVLEYCAVYVFEHIESLLRGRKVRLTDVEAVYLHPAVLGFISQRSEFADRGFGHFNAAVGNLEFHRHYDLRPQSYE